MDREEEYFRLIKDSVINKNKEYGKDVSIREELASVEVVNLFVLLEEEFRITYNLAEFENFNLSYVITKTKQLIEDNEKMISELEKVKKSIFEE